MASNNMYRVGDFVYFETSASAPYQIRRIDELNKTPTGAVEAKVACYYRRRDISSTLIQQAEKHRFVEDDASSESEDNQSSTTPGNDPGTNNNTDASNCQPHTGGGTLTDPQKHLIKHRELYLSRQIECLPATHIRGKCSVTLYNEAEPVTNYLTREDAFFYKLVYDPSQKTLQADRGAIRIGFDFQAEIQPLLKENESDSRDQPNLETLLWQPSPNSALPLAIANSDETIVDLFLTVSRSVGTLARAYEPGAAQRQPTLLSAAAAASRDITRQTAHDLLHKANYDFNRAISLLLPGGQPLLCRDQLEEWSASEVNLFEEAMEKYSKVFPDIVTDFLPWKTQAAVVECYYMWKTTDRHVQQKRLKVAAADHKLKQVYIPNYNKPNPAVLYNRPDTNGKGCESCPATSSPQWYAWGPPNLMCRLCTSCWTYWKKYGGLKNPEKKDRLAASANSPSAGPVANGGSGLTSSPAITLATATVPITVSINTTAAGAATTNASSNLATAASSESGSGAGLLPGVRCPQSGCDKEFRVKLQLSRHLTSVHGIPQSRSSIELSPNQGNSGISISSRLVVPVPTSTAAMVLGGMKPRGTYSLLTPPLVRLGRVLCADLIFPRRLARQPNRAVSQVPVQALRLEVQSRLTRNPNWKSLLHTRHRTRPLPDILRRLATHHGVPQWDSLPKPALLRRDLPPLLKVSTNLAFPLPNGAVQPVVSAATRKRSLVEAFGSVTQNGLGVGFAGTPTPTAAKQRASGQLDPVDLTGAIGASVIRQGVGANANSGGVNGACHADGSNDEKSSSVRL